MRLELIGAGLVRVQRTLSKWSSVRLFASFALALFLIQLAFTTTIRGYVVPKLTPAANWQFGLQRSSDGQAFHLDAAKLAHRMRVLGWREVNNEVFEGMSHTKIIAAIYYLIGRDNPWAVYVLNAILFACSGLLLIALLETISVSRILAMLGALILSCSPLTLFSHSELLREPFILPFVLLFVLGVLWVLDVQRSVAWSRRVFGASIAVVGFIAASTFRPYLLLLLLLAVGIKLFLVLLSIFLNRGASPFGPPQGIVTTALLVVLIVYAVPQMRGVHHYNDRSVFDTSVPSGFPGRDQLTLAELDAWRELAMKDDKSGFTRADFLVPHWCTVDWQNSWWLPKALDAKLQSIACAREDYLRFCDQSVFGARADRFCDESNFASATGALEHVPRAVAATLLVPFPRMWLDSFGGGGTGLRRIGYVVDGLLDYTLLVGLGVFVWRSRYRAPAAVIVSIALLAMLTLYGMAVPTQFILARLRLAIFTPLLAFGAAGWLLWLQENRQRASAA